MDPVKPKPAVNVRYEDKDSIPLATHFLRQRQEREREVKEIEESRERVDTLNANQHQVRELERLTQDSKSLPEDPHPSYARRFGTVLGRLMTLAGQLEAMKTMVRTSSPEIQKEVYHLQSIAQEMVDLQAGIDEARARDPKDREDPHHER